jgi:hypothetical protein
MRIGLGFFVVALAMVLGACGGKETSAGEAGTGSKAHAGGSADALAGGGGRGGVDATGFGGAVPGGRSSEAGAGGDGTGGEPIVGGGGPSTTGGTGAAGAGGESNGGRHAASGGDAVNGGSGRAGNGGEGAGGLLASGGGSETGGTLGMAGAGGTGVARAGAGGVATTGGAGDGAGGDAGAAGGAADDAPIQLVVLGASTAAGKNLDEPLYGGEVGGIANSWVNRLAATLAIARPGSVVVNLAKAGYNTYHALPTGTVNPSGAPDVDPARNITAALAENPDAVIVSFPGGGETSLGDTAADIVHNLRVIADEAGNAGVPTWVATTQPHLDQTAADTAFGLEFRQGVLDEFGSFALDFWTPLAIPDDSGADPSLMLTDGVHPNSLGHEALLDVVLAADIPGVALAR